MDIVVFQHKNDRKTNHRSLQILGLLSSNKFLCIQAFDDNFKQKRDLLASLAIKPVLSLKPGHKNRFPFWWIWISFKLATSKLFTYRSERKIE